MSPGSGTPSLENFDDLPPVEDDVSLDLSDFDNYGSVAAIPEAEETHVTEPFQDIPGIEDIILNRTGSQFFQAYLYGLSKELDWDIIDVLELFMCLDDGTVDKAYFDEEVYGDIRLTEYEWEIKNMMQKAGCDRGVFFNLHKTLREGNDVKSSHPCTSVFCPTCHNQAILKRKQSLLKYIMDVPHTHMTFTLNESAWNEISYFRDTEVGSHTGEKPPRFIDHMYNSIGEAIKYAFEKHYGVEVGFIINSHTFSSKTLEWQPHSDVFISLYGLNEAGDLVPCLYDGVIPEERKGVNTDLMKDIRKVFTAEFVSRVSKIDIPNDYEKITSEDVERYFDQSMFLETPDMDDNFYWVYQNKDQNGEIITRPLVELRDLDDVDEDDENDEDDDVDGSEQEIEGGLLGDTMRYFKRLPVAEENIIAVEENMIIFTTEKRKKKGIPPMCLTPLDFYDRVSQHMKPRGFRTLRPYGLYSPNHGKHDKAKKEAGYLTGLDIDFKDDLSVIARIVFEEIEKLGTDIDPEDKSGDQYKNILGYITVQTEKRLDAKGVLPDNFDFQRRITNIVRALLDYSCNHIEYDDHGNKITESPVLSSKELSNLMAYKTGKEVKADHGMAGYEIYDKLKKKVYSGFSEPVTDEDGDLCLWYSFSAYGELVSYSYVCLAIFNENEFKNKHQSLRSLVKDSNSYFPSLNERKEGYT